MATKKTDSEEKEIVKAAKPKKSAAPKVETKVSTDKETRRPQIRLPLRNRVEDVSELL